MVPRLYPCESIKYDWAVASANALEPDVSKHQDPYHQNPAITAYFRDLTSWKNGRNGAIAEKVGDVRFVNFKVADNVLAGIEFSLTGEYGDNMAQINGALIIGKSTNTEDRLDWGNPDGVITPRTENFVVRNVRFFNFNWGAGAAISTCSHCFHSASTDSGARTVSFEGLFFDPTTVPRRTRYQKQLQYKAILYDLDGSLTERGPKSWVTPYYEHHMQPGCELNKEVYAGVTCDGTVIIRRMAFY